MKIKNIEDLNKNINHSTLYAFLLIFGLSISGLLFIHTNFDNKRAIYENQQVMAIGEIYKSHLSEKLSIIASSATFLDFLRSGPVTRNYLYPQFLSQLSMLKDKEIVGMDIVDQKNHIIFHNGSTAASYVDLNLCYLNQMLDRTMGVCEHKWKIYFNKYVLINELKNINHSLKVCNACSAYPIVTNSLFGSFSVNAYSQLDFKIKFHQEKDYFFYIYFLLITASLISFSIWSWYRLSGMLNNYIANPIKHLAGCLKADNILEKPENTIDEIQYLINEINTWKMRINKAKEIEHDERMGRVSAQFAHDIRSPLMAIDMIVKKISHVPDEYKSILKQASQRIADIASNFLMQFKSKEVIATEINLENIITLLHSIISEKKLQYCDQPVNINFPNYDQANLTCKLNANDFKRVISNLVNNAVEASNNKEARVDVNLTHSNEFIKIQITDNGCGIPADILPFIFQGVSFSKAQGLGLGLSHAKAKILEWGGAIDVISEIGVGTTIFIQLPVII